MAELFTPWLIKPPQDSVVGKRGFVAPDAYAKVTGAAQFTRDIYRPRMLYAKCYLSPYASAVIKSMDTSLAEQYPGVKDIMRYDDPDPTRALVTDRASWYPQPVGAIVVAESEYICDRALRLIKIEWEQQNCQTDWDEAIKSGAPLLRPDLNKEDNKRQEGSSKQGDVDEGFKQADTITEFAMKLEEQTLAGVEKAACIAEFNGDNLDVWFHGQAWNTAEDMLAVFAKQSKINIHSDYNGGMFGMLVSQGTERLAFNAAAAAAKKTGRPVKFLYDESAYQGSDESCGTRNYKVGYKKDGTVTAVSLETCWTGQGMHGDIRKLQSGTRIPNLYHHFVVPYANRQIPAFMRDGANMSIHNLGVLDRVAGELGMDPTKVAEANDGCKGQSMAWVNENVKKAQGFDPTTDSLKACLEIGKKAIGWDEKWHAPGANKLANGKYHGIGFVWQPEWKESPYREQRAAVNIRYDGSADIIYRHTDSGINSALPYSQIVAAEIGLKLEDVHYQQMRHDVGMDAQTEASSSGACSNMTALVLAAQKAKRNLLEYAVKPRPATGAAGVPEAAALFPDKKPEDLDIKDSMIFEKAKPDNTQPVSAVTQLHDTSFLQAHGYTRFFTEADSPMPSYRDYNMARQCHFVEVEVDPETGQVEIQKLVLVNDVGTAINPDVLNGQQYGGAYMTMGRTFTEGIIYDQTTGVKLNGDPINYPMLTMNDIGPIDCHLVETALGYAAYGVYGIGENMSAMIALSSAAVYNAIGKWVPEIPPTPDKILKALGKV